MFSSLQVLAQVAKLLRDPEARGSSELLVQALAIGVRSPTAVPDTCNGTLTMTCLVPFVRFGPSSQDSHDLQLEGFSTKMSSHQTLDRKPKWPLKELAALDGVTCRIRPSQPLRVGQALR